MVMEDIKKQENQEPAEKVLVEAGSKPETKSEPAKIKLGSKEFNTLEEANAWVTPMEKSWGDLGRQVGELRGKKLEAQPKTIAEDIDDEDPKQIRDLEDKFYSDFPAAIKMIEARVERKLGNKLKKETLSTVEAEDNRKTVWNAFFERYPNYKTNRNRVERYVEQVLWEDVVSIEKAENQFEFIDNELKAFGISSKLANSEELPNGRPFAETGTSTRSPEIKAEEKEDEKPQKSSSFLDELSSISARR
jgi:hypothetical protein